MTTATSDPVAAGRPASVPSSATTSTPAQAQPLVGIVILNWNRPADTIACIASLRRMPATRYRVVVVDNGSSDDSVARLRAAYPDLELIENGANLGFAGGNNVGLRHLIAAGCDYLMLLNDDAEVAEDTIDRLLAVAEADPTIGFVGPTICYFGQPRMIWSAGGMVAPNGEPSHLDDLKEIGEPGQPPRNVDYVTGCAMIGRREMLERIGLLDERFFIYFEETEWCARARQHGYRVVHVPDSIMWHKLTPTARSQSPRYIYLMTRNRLLYLRATGASPAQMASAVVSMLRTSASWLLRPRHREMRGASLPLLKGMAAFALGRFGAPPKRI